MLHKASFSFIFFLSLTIVNMVFITVEGQNDDKENNAPTIFEVIYPIDNSTLTGNVKIYGSMYNISYTNISFRYNTVIRFYANMNNNHTEWFFLWDTTNLTNGFYRIEVAQFGGGPHIGPIFIDVYIVNPEPVLLTNPVMNGNSTDAAVYNGTDAIFEAPDLAGINGSLTQYYWSFGDDNGTTGPVSIHEYSRTGKYLVELKISTSNRTVSLQTPIEVIEKKTAPITHHDFKNWGMIIFFIVIVSVFLVIVHNNRMYP